MITSRHLTLSTLPTSKGCFGKFQNSRNTPPSSHRPTTPGTGFGNRGGGSSPVQKDSDLGVTFRPFQRGPSTSPPTPQSPLSASPSAARLHLPRVQHSLGSWTAPEAGSWAWPPPPHRALGSCGLPRSQGIRMTLDMCFSSRAHRARAEAQACVCAPRAEPR